MAVEVDGLDVELLRSEIQRTYAAVSREPEDTRPKAEKFGARGATIKATKPLG